MNALKLYWNQKRQESIATLAWLTFSSLAVCLLLLYGASIYLVFLLWSITASSTIVHATLMVIVHHQQHKSNLKFASTTYAKLLTHIVLVLSIIQAGAQSTTQPPPETIPPFETDVSIQLLTTNPDADRPQAVIPAAVCIGVGVGLIGWVGIKLWSACLDIQIRGLTNRDAGNIHAAAAPSTSNPVIGSGCACGISPTVDQPLPLLLEHSHDGQSWSTVSAGITTGERIFVPDTGTWRITPMKIVATRDALIVPPGTLETSTDLKEWVLVSVSASTRTIAPEANHFYRIR